LFLQVPDIVPAQCYVVDEVLGADAESGMNSADLFVKSTLDPQDFFPDSA
jgi:hypothetical protein